MMGRKGGGMDAIIGFVILAIVVLPICVSSAIKRKREREERERIAARRRELMKKYGDEEIVELIMQQKIWQGQTLEQIQDSIGEPVEVDQKVYKTKTKQGWKYQQTSRTRFLLRITTENGKVVGWDQKG